MRLFEYCCGDWQALAFLHSLKIIHSGKCRCLLAAEILTFSAISDVKPANILIAGTGIAVLSDFDVRCIAFLKYFLSDDVCVQCRLLYTSISVAHPKDYGYWLYKRV